MFCKFLDKKSAAHTGIGVSSAWHSENQWLAEELHKPITSKFEKHKVYSFFKDSIWGADLADIH